MNKRPIIGAAVGALLLFVVTGLFTKSHSQSTQKKVEAKTIYFAGGCFWGTEHFFKQIHGVVATEVGYANGSIENPTYELVCAHNTGYAETVKVDYDPQTVPLEQLIDLYFETIDPTSLNKQGHDEGTQYRTGIYYTDSTSAAVAQKKLKDLAAKYNSPIVVECCPLENFYNAEDYHQDYLDKNPTGYCHLSPALFKRAKEANRPSEKAYSRPDDATLKAQLSETQYNVTQKNATERPFENEYYDEFREGIYVDITTGEPLFISTDKFDSGCGWPAFSKPIDEQLLVKKEDLSHGMKRTEVRSKTGNSHLGHVFHDGPAEKGGLRYCINSASLRFIPKDKMKAEGYEAFLKLLEK